MQNLIIPPWQLQVDAVATEQIYSQIPQGGAIECGCCYCRNFLMLRDSLYPAKVLSTFRTLGVDYTKEVEVFQLARFKPGLHTYRGWFHCVGEVDYLDAQRGTGSVDLAVEYVWVSDELSWRLSNRRDLVNPAFDKMPLVQIDFMVQLPWVLQTEEPE